MVNEPKPKWKNRTEDGVCSVALIACLAPYDINLLGHSIESWTMFIDNKYCVSCKQTEGKNGKNKIFTNYGSIR